MTKNFQAQGLSAKGASTAAQGATKSTAGFGAKMKAMGAVAGPVAAGIGLVAGGLFKLGKTIFKAIKGLARFRAQWLGVMFISMQLSRTLQGMIKPVLQMIGIFDIWRVVLLDLMFPVLEPLLEIFFKILDWFLNLSPETKKMIGSFILIGLVLAVALQQFSQLALLMSSLGFSMGALAVVLAPFALVLGAAALAVFQLGEEASIGADKMVAFIDRGIEKAVTFIDKFAAKFEENRELILEIGSKIMGALFEGIISVLTALDPDVVSFISTLKEFFGAHKDQLMSMVKTIMDWIINFFFTFLPDLIEIGGEILSALLQGLRENEGIWRPALKEVIDTIGEIIEELAPEIMQIGAQIIKIMVRGMIEAIHEFVTKIPGRIVSALGGAFGGGGVQPIRSFQAGGYVPSTGAYRLHQGETVVPKNASGGVTLNVTYNIEISDKEEMEGMMRDNNIQLVEEIKRQIAI